MGWFRRRRAASAERAVPLAEPLEPRLLFSADIAGGLLLGASAEVAAETRVLTSTGEYAAANDNAPALAYAAMPLAFEQNVGQVQAGLDFTAYGSGYAIGLAHGEAWLSLAGEGGRHVIHLDLQGGRDDVQAEGEGLLAARSNVYLGNDPSAWRTDIANYGSVLYRGVYEGVDVRYYGAQRQLEYDFIVAAGADAGAIRLRFGGVESATIADDGDLVLRVQGSEAEVRFQAPVSYQRGELGREAVASRYVVHADGSIGFELGAYDRTRELVIDPVLDYASYIGGSGAENATGIAVDGSGNVYVTGRTASTNFPTAGGGSLVGSGGDGDMYVARFDPTLGTLQFATRIGGSFVLLGGAGDEQGKAIAVDGSGNVIVTGWTSSSNFPTTAGAPDTSLNGGQDAVVVKLNASGALQFSTYVGGNGGTDSGNAVVTDAAGNFYVAGQMSDSGLLSGVLGALLGNSDNAFIHKYAANGTVLFEQLFGGNALDVATGLALSGSQLFMVGNTQSANVPMVNAHQGTIANTIDGFLARIDTADGSVDYATYVGSSEDDTVTAVATDGSGKAYVVGVTRGRNTDPFDTTTGAWRTTAPVNNADTGFLRVYDTTLAPASQLVYSTYLGGDGVDRPTGVAVANGRVVVVGTATSTSGLATADAHDASNNGQAMYLAVLSPAGNGAADLLYATYFGQGMSPGGVAMHAGKAYVAAGTTGASQATAGGAQTALSGSSDGMVVAFTIFHAPTLTSFSAPVDTVAEDTQVEITFAELQAQGNEADADGTVQAFVVRSVASGTLRIGASAASATAWAAGSNDTITAGLHAYWTPAAEASGALGAFSVVARDNDGSESAAPVLVRVNVTAVNDPPVVTVPGAQATAEDGPIVFSGASAITVSDVDAGTGNVQVTITVTQGTVSLGGTTVAAGGEFRINTTTTGLQQFDADSRQSVAMDAAGNFVVVWQSPDAGGTGVFAQRFNAAGVAQGAQFQVNTTTAGEQGRAVVAMDAAGNFVVAWESENQDGTSWGVFARRFDAAGNALAGEFQVNVTATANERRPSIAMSAAGAFVIAWHAGDPSGVVGSFDVHARRFDAAGNALGGEFRVNTTTPDGQLRPAVAMDAAGNFVVVWQALGQDGSGYAVVGQRYDAAGNALGGEFVVNNTAADNQWHATVAMNASGSFVVAWESFGQDGNDHGIFARRYDAGGKALGDEFRVNTMHQHDQLAPSVGIADDGSFVVSWDTKTFDMGNSQGVFLQRYSADGVALGGETEVNTTTAGDQQSASLAMSGGGDFVVVWSGNGPGDASGIFGQRHERFGDIAFTTGNGLADTTMVFTGTVADVNAALAGLVFRPATEYAGPASMQVTVDDLGNTGGPPRSASGSIPITVAAVNDSPVLALVRLTVAEGATVVLGTGNIVVADPDSSSFTYTVSGLTGGVFQVFDGSSWNTSGSFTSAQLAAGQVRFVDDGDELPPAFSLTASDGNSSSNTRAANITFSNVNDAPVLSSAQLAVGEGGTVVLGTANFGAADPDSTALTYTVSAVSGGSFQVWNGATWNAATTFTAAQLAAGSVRFVDDGDEVAPAFSVRVGDGSLDSATVAATVTFTPANDAPVLASAQLAVGEGATVVLGTANFGVSDPDSTSFNFSVSAVSGGTFQLWNGSSWNATTSFTSAQLAAGAVRFVDDGDEVAPAFSVTVGDGAASGNTLAASIVFTPANDAPVLTGAMLVVTEGGTVVLAPGAFPVSDPDSTAFTFTLSGVTGGSFQVWNGSSWNAAGTFTSAQLSAGSVRFVDDGDETIPAYTLTVSDGTATGNTLTGSISFTSVNDAPVITSATLAVTEGGTVVLGPGNFAVTDPDNGSFVFILSNVSGGSFEVWNGGSWGGAGSFTSAQLAAGAVRFVDDVDGAAPSFEVRINDGSVDGNTLAAVITYTPANQAPMLTGAQLAVTEGGTVVLGAANFSVSDPDSGAFIFTISTSSGGIFQVFDGTSWNAATTFSSAQLAAGAVRFVDDGDEVAPGFSVTVSDGTATGNTVAASITFTMVNDGPSLTGASLTVGEGGTVVLAPGNFIVGDPDDTAFTYSVSGVSGGTFQVFDAGSWIPSTTFTSAQLAAGAVRFVHDGNEAAPAFSVRVDDGDADSATVAASITFTSANDAPVLTGAQLAVAEGGTVVLGSGNFTVSDPDSSDFTFTVSALSGGSLQVFDGSAWNAATTFTSAQLAAGAVRFVDDGDEVAPAFSVTVSDGPATGNTLAVGVTFTGVNDAPVLAGASLAVGEGGTVLLVQANFAVSDPDGTAFTYTVSAVSGGSFQVFDGTAWNVATTFTSSQLAAGAVRFVDDGDEVAPAFSVRVNDGAADSATVAAVITFTAANDAPVLTGAQLAVTEGGTVILGSGNFSVTDPDSSAFTFSVSAVSGGTFQVWDGAAWNAASSFTSVQLAAGWVRFVDDGDEVPPAFSVTVSDGTATGNTLAAGITFTGVNDAPVLTGATLSVSEGGTVALGPVQFAVADSDSTSFTFTIANLAGGSFQVFDGSTWNAASSFTSAQLLAGQVRFVDDGDEAAPSFDVTVSDGSATGNTLAAAITYTPINDAPVIAGPGTVSVNVWEGVRPVATIAATDADRPAQSLTWSLAGGNDAALFTIDPVTGVLWFAADPDFEMPMDHDRDNVYEVVVRVSDGSLAATQVLGIVVGDVDDTSPPAVSPAPVPPAPVPAPEPPVASSPVVVPAPAPAPARASATERPAGSPTPSDQAAGFGPGVEAQLVGPPAAPNFASIASLRSDAGTEGTRLLQTVVFDPRAVQLIAAQAPDLVLSQFGLESRGEAGRVEELQRSLRSPQLAGELDRLRENVREELALDQSVTISVASVSLGVSVLYVLWLIRGGVLLGSYLSALPAWRLLDPLPVLSRVDDEPEEDDEGFEDMDRDGRDTLRGFG